MKHTQKKAEGRSHRLADLVPTSKGLKYHWSCRRQGEQRKGKKIFEENNTQKLPNLILKNDKSTDLRNSTNPQQGKHTPPLPSTSCSSYRKPVMERTSEARKGRRIASSGVKKVY